MNKRKQSAVLGQRDSYSKRNDSKFYAVNENKTIDFTQAQSKKTKKPVELIPQSKNQEKYIVALTDPDTDIVVVSGPAGTGKTYLAMIAAIKALKSGDCDKILLTRPAVAVDDEKHGFLPGDINSKMEPWVRPLFDVLREFYTTTELEYMIKEQVVEITPLAFCRGRNFKHSYIILDEAQNATPSQIKMLLTRISTGSKIIVTGDVEQTDRQTADNGLLDLISRIENYSVPGMKSCKFDTRDIRRHKIIEHVLTMYG